MAAGSAGPYLHLRHPITAACGLQSKGELPGRMAALVVMATQPAAAKPFSRLHLRHLTIVACGLRLRGKSPGRFGSLGPAEVTAWPATRTRAPRLPLRQ